MKTLWKSHPGSLTLNTLEYIQELLMSQTGQLWNIDTTAVPPLFSQFWRMILKDKTSGPRSRETQTLCCVQDLLLQGKIAMATDVITQRLKGLEQVAGGSHYSVTQRQELVPTETTFMATPAEVVEASRLQKEEARARAASARPWERRPDWERRGDDGKGRNKGKEYKGKGKGKGDQGHQRDDKDKPKK